MERRKEIPRTLVNAPVTRATGLPGDGERGQQRGHPAGEDPGPAPAADLTTPGEGRSEQEWWR
jgi:hypothetical protein